MNDDETPDALTIASYLIAAAILTPLAYWLSDYFQFEEWIRANMFWLS